jgi:hypothetical protein
MFLGKYDFCKMLKVYKVCSYSYEMWVDSEYDQQVVECSALYLYHV